MKHGSVNEIHLSAKIQNNVLKSFGESNIMSGRTTDDSHNLLLKKKKKNFAYIPTCHSFLIFLLKSR